MKHTSLFTKLTLLIFLSTITGVVITHAVMFLSFHNMHKKMPAGDSLYHMSNYIASQIEIENVDSTKALLRMYNFELRYKKGEYEWSSRNSVPKLETVMRESRGRHSFWLHNDIITLVNRDGAFYIFQGIDPFKKIGFPWDIVILWSVFLIAIFAFVYYKIRQFLKPICVLHSGVLQANKGDFEIKLQRTTNDELGELITSFNSMALKVRNDIRSRDQLLRDISHEFRSPLSRMTMALEFIPEGNIRQTLKNNIHILEKMTISILEEERIDSPYGKIKREEVDLKSMLQEIADIRNQSVTYVIVQNTEQLLINADKERMRMAISNVIDNGIKYSLNSGRPVEINYLLDGTNAIVNITDHGIGIAESEIPFVFEPFYRVDKSRKNTGGYGLGMSLAKKIINAHEGTVSITSVPNSGTTVTITLPVSL